MIAKDIMDRAMAWWLQDIDWNTVWRIFIGAAVLGVLYHVAWACGWLPNSGFARADEINEIVDQKLAPIERRLSGLEQQVTKNGDDMSAFLRITYAKEICAAVIARKSAATATEKSRITDTINRLQDLYKSVNGDVRLPESACE